ncbi:4Fe-4S binding protein [Pelotalea chapellei]|uniref:4Fe-4S binding protein n=1 Tax=Pelotalea chapellei TaxID=44671 RepID=A0ABS5U6D3_9BACT|nr:4Fe-4S binding protein [Pelotalea chapellei]MBT1071209.1 4Fe-4S binding protein [Pelotalea chapellei]
MHNLLKNIPALRRTVQCCFLIWVIGIGIRFGMFVHAVENGTVPLVSRPPGVEGFLPIGALTSLKYWLSTGIIHPVHPAALIIFLAILLMSLLAKKSFCSWLCPVGTLSEITHNGGRRLFGRNFRIWRWLDYALRGLKYLLLALFIKLILLDMPTEALAGFMNAPYWAVSDIKMLHFFTSMSMTAMLILALLTGLSLVYKNFWCRYLCPYGALLGLASLFSPFKIRRNETGCTDCRSCSSACPSALPVHSRHTVHSVECTGCLTCVARCPKEGVLQMQLPLWKQSLPVWLFPVVALLIFAAVIGVGMAGHHWHSSLTLADYQHLIPMLPNLSH